MLSVKSDAESQRPPDSMCTKCPEKANQGGRGSGFGVARGWGQEWSLIADACKRSFAGDGDVLE